MKYSINTLQGFEMNRVKVLHYLLYLISLFTLSPSFAQQLNKEELSVSSENSKGAFNLSSAAGTAFIMIDPVDAEVVQVAAASLKDDIKKVTNYIPTIIQGKTNQEIEFAVIAGTIGQSSYIDELIKRGNLPWQQLSGKWEAYHISLVSNPAKNIKRALVIAGSDRRGTAFGIFELSRRIGVHPFYWWADIIPQKKKGLFIKEGASITGQPSVKYRGIFLNDEDWGLQPWAAKNMDKDIKDIGPKTYEKIFELLLRLKANYIWPAMHPCTKAFWFYKEDARIAEKYAIVLGASHCEPMLRNNVFEWAENFEHEYNVKPGEWRYDLNKGQIYTYWQDRVAEAKNTEAVYTVGMRGIHDGSMPGPKAVPEKVALLDQIIIDQRDLLAKQTGKPAPLIPQIFCPYKEVLQLYRAGLKLPDDVTIVWSDDNHGYIRQLSNEEEKRRSGGSGVYYHLSYWGKPQDYLWLSSISPTLISYEMSKAYNFGADRLWVFNAGDIKPAEMEIQFALEHAWDVKKWTPEKAINYAYSWAAEIFGQENAENIALIKKEYYRLAASGKPEHINAVTYTNDERERRLVDYKKLSEEAEKVAKAISPSLQDAYFGLVLYPVLGAGLMNEKIFFAQKSKEANFDANIKAEFSAKAKSAYDKIQVLTAHYNTKISSGKWNGIMSAHPRDQKVFDKPEAATVSMVTNTEQALTDNYKRIKAHQYSYKKEKKGYAFKTINGLGITESCIALMPVTSKSYSKSEIKEAPFIEYKIKVPAGNKKLIVKCLPTFKIYEGHSIGYAVSINNGAPQVMNLETEADGKLWSINVLRGFAQGVTEFIANGSQETSIKIYFTNPGLVVNSVEIQ
ncbi:MAG TPA: glycosyl hydrolase 115 family protein [Chitinophagaceae bacterium]|nr:glycosyl hydrolase 115 family protein [Chitinophagaceae bacterium]